jgi:serine/threonine-protein kinase
VLDALADTPVEVTQTEAYDDAVPAGSVADFDPAAGTELRRGDPLTIVVSQGPAPVAVPEVVGLERLEAVNVLRDGHLNVNQQEDFSNDVEPGLVISQDPTPDVEPVVRGTTVTIVVSKGPDLVLVPDVDGLPLSEATATLEAAGFVVDSTCFLCSDGTVTLQDPGGGDMALRGSTISLLATF